MESHTKAHPFIWFLFIPAIVVGIVVFAADIIPTRSPEANSVQTSFGGGLRGMTFLITFPSTNGRVERLNVSIHRAASRVLSQPPARPTYSDEILVSPAIWNSLENLRQLWCANVPPVPQVADVDQLYSIAVDCNHAVNPIVYLPANQLPSVLRELIDTVPPAPTPQPR